MKKILAFFLSSLFWLPLALLIPLCFASSWDYPRLIPRAFSARHIVYVFFENPGTLFALFHTLLIASTSGLLTVALAIPTAQAVSGRGFFGKSFLLLLLFAPIAIPSVTLTTGLHGVMLTLRLAGTFAGIVLAHAIFAIPYAVFILAGVFKVLGNHFTHTAQNLGATGFQAFLYVTLPLLMPAIIVSFTVSFAVSLSQYISTFIIGGGAYITLTMLLVPHLQNGQIPVASVYSVLLTLSSIVVLFFTERVISNRMRLKVAYL